MMMALWNANPDGELTMDMQPTLLTPRKQLPLKGRHSTQQAGLSLLEVMITVVILSLGLLGLAGLQITGLQNTRNAYYSSIANQHIQSMAELIRSDVTNMRTGRYDNLGSCKEEGCTNTCDKDEKKCPSHQAWLSQVATALPGGAGRVRETSNGSNAFYIAVLWSDPQLTSTSWQADTAANPATSACGAPTTGANCSYIQFQP